MLKFMVEVKSKFKCQGHKSESVTSVPFQPQPLHLIANIIQVHSILHHEMKINVRFYVLLSSISQNNTTVAFKLVVVSYNRS